jgi:sigma-B regulation protein RsbU (phosphoserine phosphatase)
VTALNDPALEGFEYIIPVLHKKKPIGFSFIGNFASNELDTIEEKLKMIQTITNIILVANENKILFKNQMEQMLLQKELKVAADIQNLLIPSSLIDNEYVTAAAFYKPHKNVGGDYYDLIQTGENEIVFCICDISGKGVPAALLMANFQANLRAIVARGYNLDTTVTLLNKKVKEITQGEKFITLFIAKYNFSTRKLQYVNAGHNPPISIYKESVNLLDKGCTIIGMFDELPFLAVGEEMMPEGSKLICFTDGLTEASNESNELFELDRLITFIKDNNHLDVNQINADLVDRINLFKGENDFDDDLTLLSLCFH